MIEEKEPKYMTPGPSAIWGLVFFVVFLFVPLLGHAWTPVGPWGGVINDLKSHSGVSDTIYAATGNGIYTLNGSLPWRAFENTVGYGVDKVVPDPLNNVLYALARPSTDNGLGQNGGSYPLSGDLYSLDASSLSGSFSSLITTEVSAMAVCDDGDLLVAVNESSGGFIYRFSGGGTSYVKDPPGPDSYGYNPPIYSLLGSAGSSTVYLAQNSSSLGQIWKSENCGVSWSLEANSGSGLEFISLGYGAGGDVLAGTSDEDVWVRDSSLQTWSKHPGSGLPSDFLHEYPVVGFGTGPIGEVFAILQNHQWWNGGFPSPGLFRMSSIPQGSWSRWTELDVVSSQLTAVLAYGEDLLVAFKNAGIYRVPMGDRLAFTGEAWDEGIRAVSLEGMNIDARSGRRLAYGASGVYLGEFQDGNWQRLLFGSVEDNSGNPISDPQNLQFIREGKGYYSGDFSTDDQDLIWVGGQAGLLRARVSTAGAGTWTSVFTSTAGDGRVWVVRTDPFAANRIWWGTPGGVFYSGDMGQTFDRVTGPAQFDVRDIKFELLEPGTRHFLAGWEADSNCSGLLASDDDGQTWYEALFDGESVTALAFNPQNPGGDPAAVVGFNWENLQGPITKGLAVVNNGNNWIPDPSVGLPSGHPNRSKFLSLDIPVGVDGDGKPDAIGVVWGNMERGIYHSYAGTLQASPGEDWTKIGGLEQFNPTSAVIDPKNGNLIWVATREASLFTLMGNHFRDVQGPSWDYGIEIQGIGSTDTTLYLSWPAPGDDGKNFGWADRYELRYAANVFSQGESFSTWGNMVPSLPAPRLAHYQEVIPVDFAAIGLLGNSLAFALRAFDEQNHPSDVHIMTSNLLHPVARQPLGNVSASITPAQVVFSWDTSPLADDPYFQQHGAIAIERNGETVAVLDIGQQGWSDNISQLGPGTVLTYQITAVDGIGNGVPVTEYVTVPDGKSTGGSEGGGGGGGCFIATAAYGTVMEPEVDLLRHYRDSYLRHRVWGRTLVHLYEITSPPVADYISQRPWLRAMTRLALSPIIVSVQAAELGGTFQVLPILTGVFLLPLTLALMGLLVFSLRWFFWIVKFRNRIQTGT
jgi:hypothetical protein